MQSLGKRGEKSIMIVPVAFTTDHIETLSEIDIELRETAEESGIEHFGRSPMFNGVVSACDSSL